MGPTVLAGPASLALWRDLDVRWSASWKTQETGSSDGVALKVWAMFIVFVEGGGLRMAVEFFLYPRPGTALWPLPV